MALHGVCQPFRAVAKGFCREDATKRVRGPRSSEALFVRSVSILGVAGKGCEGPTGLSHPFCIQILRPELGQLGRVAVTGRARPSFRVARLGQQVAERIERRRHMDSIFKNTRYGFTPPPER